MHKSAGYAIIYVVRRNAVLWADKRYHSLDYEMKARYGHKIYKIALDGGFTCPNRDGLIDARGCIFCSAGGSGDFAEPQHASVTEQIEAAKARVSAKIKNGRYIAYFQSYTNTYDALDKLTAIYEEALAHPKVAGIVVGTRPDCVNDELLDYFAALSKRCYVMIEYGIESTEDSTLEFINRGHDYACAVKAIEATAARGIYTGAHLILGLPQESRETILNHARKISTLPLTAIKLHQLQLVKHTKMSRQYAEHPEWFKLYTADEYIDLVIDFIELLNPKIAIERMISQSPPGFVIAPEWGLKNFEFIMKVDKRLAQRNIYQGRLYNESYKSQEL